MKKIKQTQLKVKDMLYPSDIKTDSYLNGGLTEPEKTQQKNVSKLLSKKIKEVTKQIIKKLIVNDENLDVLHSFESQRARRYKQMLKKEKANDKNN